MAEQWYYAKQGQRFGPISFENLKQLGVSGKITSTDLIWRTGMANWTPAGKVEGLSFVQTPLPVSQDSGPEDNSSLGFLDSMQRTSITAGKRFAQKVTTVAQSDAVRQHVVAGQKKWSELKKRRPTVGRLIPPSSSLLALLLFLLPWITVSCNNLAVVKQSGLQSCYGGVSLTSEMKRMMQERPGAFQEKSGPNPAPLMLLYGLALAAGLVLGIGVYSGNQSLRNVVIACSVAAFAILTLQLLLGFPAENEILENMKDHGGNPMMAAAIHVQYTLWMWLSYFASATPAVFLMAEKRGILPVGQKALEPLLPSVSNS